MYSVPSRLLESPEVEHEGPPRCCKQNLVNGEVKDRGNKNGLQQQEVFHGSFKRSWFLLVQTVDDVIAILRPEVKPQSNQMKQFFPKTKTKQKTC